ncbi:MAG: hypothetical protein QOJ12_1919, partial [Thermoleophilales bacterium]|nr:hypothetical protein [Thermoleophilales bacterium]
LVGVLAAVAFVPVGVTVLRPLRERFRGEA